jgi:hypothetical protein
MLSNSAEHEENTRGGKLHRKHKICMKKWPIHRNKMEAFRDNLYVAIFSFIPIETNKDLIYLDYSTRHV